MHMATSTMKPPTVQSRHEIFNQIALQINDLTHKYNDSMESFDHSSFDLKRLSELQEKKSAFQDFHILVLETEMQATLRKREIGDHQKGNGRANI